MIIHRDHKWEVWIGTERVAVCDSYREAYDQYRQRYDERADGGELRLERHG